MKIIYVSPFIMYPPSFGLGIRNYHILKHLSSSHGVIAVTLGPDPTGQTDSWLEQHCCSVIRLPWAYSSNLSENTNYLVNTVKRIFRYPTFSFKRYYPKRLAKKLHEIVNINKDADLIYFDTQLVGQVRLYQNFDKPCLLSLADIYEMQIRNILLQAGWRPYFAVYLSEWIKTAVYESRILKRFRNIITVSLDEKDLVAHRAPWAQVVLFPNGVDTTYYSPETLNCRPNNGEIKLVFVGTFAYHPNVQGFFFFYEKIFPLIRQAYPQVQFFAVGHNPSDEMIKVAGKDPSVFVTGTVDDVREYYSQASVVVIPLQVGSGTKLKTLEALAMGLPVVSTQVGCQGIKVKNNEHLIVADTPDTFAEKVIWLLEHPILAKEMSHNGRLFVENYYDWTEIIYKLSGYLENLNIPTSK